MQALVDGSDCYRDRGLHTAGRAVDHRPSLPSLLPCLFLYYAPVSIAFEYSVVIDNGGDATSGGDRQG